MYGCLKNFFFLHFSLFQSSIVICRKNLHVGPLYFYFSILNLYLSVGIHFKCVNTYDQTLDFFNCLSTRDASYGLSIEYYWWFFTFHVEIASIWLYIF